MLSGPAATSDDLPPQLKAEFPRFSPFWDSVAEEALRLGSAVRLSGEKQLLYLENLRVGEMQKPEFNGTMVTTMHKIQSVRAVGVQAGTLISVHKHATSPFCRGDILYMVPASPICIHDYSKHWEAMVAPFPQ